MAIKIFQGGDGDWSNTANWDTGTIPVSNDIAVMGDHNISVTAGLDQGGIDLDALIMPPTYGGNIGSSGSPLKIAADLVEHRGTGELYYASDKDGVSAFKTDLIVIASQSGVTTELDSNSADAGDIANIVCLRGNVVLAGNIIDSAGVLRVEVGHMGNATSDTKVTISTGVATIVDYDQWGGSCTNNVAISDCRIRGGTIFHEVGAITDLDVTDGTFVLNAKETVTTARARKNGIIDMMQNAKSKTITTAYLMPHGRILRDVTGGHHTITTLYDLRQQEV